MGERNLGLDYCTQLKLLFRFLFAEGADFSWMLCEVLKLRSPQGKVYSVRNSLEKKASIRGTVAGWCLFGGFAAVRYE